MEAAAGISGVSVVESSGVAAVGPGFSALINEGPTDGFCNSVCVGSCCRVCNGGCTGGGVEADEGCCGAGDGSAIGKERVPFFADVLFVTFLKGGFRKAPPYINYIWAVMFFFP